MSAPTTHHLQTLHFPTHPTLSHHIPITSSIFENERRNFEYFVLEEGDVGFRVALNQRDNELINLSLPIFQFQSTYFICQNNPNTYVHYINRQNKKFQLPFRAEFFVEVMHCVNVQQLQSAGMEGEEHISAQPYGYFISENASVARIDSQLNVEYLYDSSKEDATTTRAISHVSIAGGIIALYANNTNEIMIFHIAHKEMHAFKISADRLGISLNARCITQWELMRTSTELLLFIFVESKKDHFNGEVHILKVEGVASNRGAGDTIASPHQNPSISSHNLSGDDSLSVPNTHSTCILTPLNNTPLKRQRVIAIKSLPILDRPFKTAHTRTESLNHVLIICAQESSSSTPPPLSFEIVNLLTFLNDPSSKSAFTRYNIDAGLPSSTSQYLSVSVPPETIQVHPKSKEITSFRVQMLTKKAIYNFDFLTMFERALQYITSMGPEFFSPTRQEEISKEIGSILTSVRKKYPEHAVGEHSFDLLLDTLWEYNLTAVITQYIGYKKRTEMGREIYVLHNPVHVYEWTKDMYMRVKGKAVEIARRVTDFRALSHTERIEARQELSQTSREINSLLLIVEALSFRAQDDSSQRDLDSFCAQLEKTLDYVRVFEWFLAEGFIPTQSRRYNTQQMVQHFNQEFVTFTQSKILAFNEETMETRRERSEMPNFVSHLISRCSKQDFEYPPHELTELLDLFLDDQNTFESRASSNDQLRHNHLLMIYFLVHNRMASGQDDFDIVSKYAKQFNITTGWQQLIYAFYQMDTGEVGYPETINHLRNVDVPEHEWHNDIVAALYSLEEYTSATMYLDKVPEASYDPSLQLHCLLVRDLLAEALEFQRKDLYDSSEMRDALFADILHHCMESKRTMTLFGLHLTEREERFLIRFLQQDGEQGRDLLFSYFVLHHQFERAARLFKDSAPQVPFTKAALTNIMDIIPKTQRMALFGSDTGSHPVLGGAVPLFDSPAMRGVLEKSRGGEERNAGSGGIVRKRGDAMMEDDEEYGLVDPRPSKRM